MDNGKYLDSASEITLEVVKTRAVKGIISITSRNFILQALGLVATFLLTIFLTPQEFGLFFIVSAAVNIFSGIDMGLGAALIQKKDQLSRRDLATTFTVQNAFILIFIAVIFLATPLYRSNLHLDQEAVYLLWALAFYLLLASLKSIPSLLMERELDFKKYVIPQVAEQVLYYAIVVTLAWRGFGVTSYTAAVLISGVCGLALIYFIRPWRPSIAFDKACLKQLLRFGLPYQTNSLLAKVKDDGLIVVLGGIMGPNNAGLLSWALKWANAPLRFFMDQVIKVTFPAFSRMQDHQEELSRAVSKSIFFICLLVFPTLVALVFISPLLVSLIPKYTKWHPALLALGLISINSAWAAVTTPLTNVLNAIGKIKTTFRLMIMWTVLAWIFIPGLAFLYGLNGAAVGYALVGSSSIVAILIAVKSVHINFLESVGKPLIAAVFMMALLILGRQFIPISWVWMFLLLFAAITVYSLVIFILVGPILIENAKKMVPSFRGSS